MEGLRKGKLVVISGPMFSGKTSRLIELLEREMIAGRKIELFKPEIDKRYSQAEVVTHKGAKLPAKSFRLMERESQRYLSMERM
jgi:Thymidine kinase